MLRRRLFRRAHGLMPMFDLFAVLDPEHFELQPLIVLRGVVGIGLSSPYDDYRNEISVGERQ